MTTTIDTTTRGTDERRAASDVLDLDSLFSAEELALRDTVREFVDRRIRPNIARWYEEAVFPTEIIPELGKLGVLGMHLDGFQRIVADPCSVSVVRYTETRPFVVKINDTGSDVSALLPAKDSADGSDATVGGSTGAESGA